MSSIVRRLGFLLAFLIWINTSESSNSDDIVNILQTETENGQDLNDQLDLLKQNLNERNPKIELLEFITKGSGDTSGYVPIYMTLIDDEDDDSMIDDDEDSDDIDNYGECKDDTYINEVFSKKLQIFLENLKKQSKDLAEKVSTLEIILHKKSIKEDEEDEMVKNPYDQHFNCLKNCNNPAKSCTDALKDTENNKEGVYLLSISESNPSPFYGYCIHESVNDNGWLIIQRREDGAIDFDRNWFDYKYGFGDLNGEYWIGLERLHAITSAKPHELWIVLIDYNSEGRNVRYSRFAIGDESEGYKLTLGDYSGDGDIDALRKHKNMKFSTFDKDHDETSSNCAQTYKGGWWYKSCFHCNLNGIFRSQSNKRVPYEISGIKWRSWHKEESLRYTHMAIREL